MPWTDAELDTLKTRMVEAKRQGAWISAIEAQLVLSLIWTIKRLTMSKGWAGIADGPLPTIADTKAQGITAFYVTCASPNCRTTRRLTFDNLFMPGRRPVPDTVAFVEIPKVCRFRCRQCNGRNVSVMADWPDPIEKRRREVIGDEGR